MNLVNRYQFFKPTSILTPLQQEKSGDNIKVDDIEISDEKNERTVKNFEATKIIDEIIDEETDEEIEFLGQIKEK